MKILLANTRHFPGGGDSTYTFNLSELLSRRGHEVAFFAMQDERNLPDRNSDLFVTFIDFRELGRRKSLATGLQVLTRAIFSQESRRKFGQLLERFRPDIVHLQNIHGHLTPSIILEAQSRDIPLVWTLHDYKLICPNSHFVHDVTGTICEACGQGRFYRAASRRCKKGSLLASTMAGLEAYSHQALRVPRRVDSYLSPSAFLRSKLLARGFPERRVHHVPLFIPQDQVSAERPRRSDPFILFLGRLEPLKGIHVLLRAAQLVPSVRLLLAGRAEEAFATELKGLLPTNTTYVGMKHGAELQELLQDSSALVLPSVCYENQPFSILEAFAVGKPVIASDLGGMTELVKHGERGLLTRAGDAPALAQAMEWMISHPSATAAMGQRAQSYCLEVHGEEGHYDQLVRIYEGVLTRQEKAGSRE